MTEYSLYLESGPQHRKTMVHVLDLLGCMANGPTSEAAVAATPDAIEAYLRFLKGAGEPVDPAAPFTTRVVEHITEGVWLGNGSPYVLFAPDLTPVSERELGTYVARFVALRAALASWAETQSDEQLDAPPAGGGRTGRSILMHVLGTPAAYLSAALGTISGASRVYTLAERGEIGLSEGLRRIADIAVERLRATTPEERAFVRERPKDVRTLRKAIRRTLEHDWEHLRELSRRPGGPAV